jgi:hypothetical protein
MSDAVQWYRSTSAPPDVTPTRRREARNWLQSWLPEPCVRGKTLVLTSRRTLPIISATPFRAAFHGVFSEFHSVLGALAYGETHGATGVRVDFASPLYAEPGRSPNWWTYYFDRDAMYFEDDRGPAAAEIRLDRTVSKYGRYGGFADVVQGRTPYLYPMTFGVERATLRHLLDRHVQVRQEIHDEVARLVSTLFEPGAFIVGVHYRGTDSTRSRAAALAHYRTTPVPYTAYAAEVRRALQDAAPAIYRVFVATDEIDFLEFMRREFGDRVVQLDDAPRAQRGGQAVHLDRTLPVSNYRKGRSAVVDCLMLAATHYLVKGRSNLSDASLAFNPTLPYSFCPDTTVRA